MKYSYVFILYCSFFPPICISLSTLILVASYLRECKIKGCPNALVCLSVVKTALDTVSITFESCTLEQKLIFLYTKRATHAMSWNLDIPQSLPIPSLCSVSLDRCATTMVYPACWLSSLTDHITASWCI